MRYLHGNGTANDAKKNQKAYRLALFSRHERVDETTCFSSCDDEDAECSGMGGVKETVQMRVTDVSNEDAHASSLPTLP